MCHKSVHELCRAGSLELVAPCGHSLILHGPCALHHDRLFSCRDVLCRDLRVGSAETVQRYLSPGEGDGRLHAVLETVADPHVFLCADSFIRNVVLLPDCLVAVPPQPVNGPAHGGFCGLVHAARNTGQQSFRPLDSRLPRRFVDRDDDGPGDSVGSRFRVHSSTSSSFNRNIPISVPDSATRYLWKNVPPSSSFMDSMGPCSGLTPFMSFSAT